MRVELLSLVSAFLCLWLEQGPIQDKYLILLTFKANDLYLRKVRFLLQCYFLRGLSQSSIFAYRSLTGEKLEKRGMIRHGKQRTFYISHTTAEL